MAEEAEETGHIDAENRGRNQKLTNFNGNHGFEHIGKEDGEGELAPEYPVKIRKPRVAAAVGADVVLQNIL
ncbi:hypothetical protein SDC9_185227 [bioreactor metagenome]|uniref:Uncharacterized protein n=1 Tax=bioreactor metagenome TaxID=1076179 RepID=A0A645HF93_9ZZZZ